LAILAHVTKPRAQPLHGNISHKFLLETRLEFDSFEPLTFNYSWFQLYPKLQQVIESLKDLDFSIVSTKNISDLLSLSGLGPGPDQVCQIGLKLLHL